jgi:hypothetical protein
MGHRQFVPNPFQFIVISRPTKDVSDTGRFVKQSITKKEESKKEIKKRGEEKLLKALETNLSNRM